MIKELIKIQRSLKAPKGQWNSFGKYKYRSAEDILEAVKPLLHEYGCTLIMSDEVIAIGTRYYVKAIATLYNSSGESISNTGWAREEEDKKGMDGSQITGTASSYARKYALNGLFLIDDTKDADTNEYHNQTQVSQQKEKKVQKVQQPFTPQNIAELIKTLDANTNAELIKVLKALDEAKTKEEVNAIWQANKTINNASYVREWAIWKGKQL
jgi:G3E family GTPase